MTTLAPGLQALPDDVRRVWENAQARQDTFEAIISTWEQGSSALEERVARADGAVTAGLAAVGLPRGPIAGVRIEAALPLWAGRKTPTCHILFNGWVLRDTLQLDGGSDDVLRTWVHESLHARQPYDAGAL